MRSLFWLLAVFAAAVALVIVGRLDAGYAVVVFPPYRIEASLLFVAITALLHKPSQSFAQSTYCSSMRMRRSPPPPVGLVSP